MKEQTAFFPHPRGPRSKTELFTASVTELDIKNFNLLCNEKRDAIVKQMQNQIKRLRLNNWISKTMQNLWLESEEGQRREKKERGSHILLRSRFRASSLGDGEGDVSISSALAISSMAGNDRRPERVNKWRDLYSYYIVCFGRCIIILLIYDINYIIF